MMLYTRALVLYLLLIITWITAAAAYQHPLNFTEMKQNSGKSILFSIVGNVFPLGYYAVNMTVGNPPKMYLLDIDTGSDLTWISCDGNEPPPGNPYDFTKDSAEIVPCSDEVCSALGGDSHKETHNNCLSPPKDHPCDYTVGYADGTSVTGFLVRDQFPFKFRTGESDSPLLTFGCGFYQTQNDKMHQPNNDGILGLGNGRAGILAQLSQKGVTENIFGHCFSGKDEGGGYISFGGIPLVGIVWKQIVTSDGHYSLGSADIMFSDEVTDIRGLGIVFDSGSTYTYLKPIAYGALLDLIEKNLTNKAVERAPEDKTLPVCWKASVGHFKTVDDVTSYFPNLALNFTDVESVVNFQMRPNSYLIISGEGNACLGILNGGEVGLGDLNLIGDISMHDKLVIYDNKNDKVGWVEANCSVRVS